MTEYLDTYCPECDTEVRAVLHTQLATLAVRGEEVFFDEAVAVCPVCHMAIGDTRVESANLERAYSVYRAKHGLMSPDEIKNIRKSYGLSLREFSKFLGFGEQTVYRYEHGDIPDQAHNITMISARSIEGARLLLSQNRQNLSDRSVVAIERHIQALADDAVHGDLRRLAIEERQDDGPSAANGFRRLDLDRVAALVFELASRCRELYWTKLQKAAFFADMVCYERSGCSLTGLTYAHATFGPVIDRRDEVRYILVDRGTVFFIEDGWGEIVVPMKPCGCLFGASELELIDEVAEFVNSFDTASDLSEFSHKLSCWNKSADGEIMPYTWDDGEIGSAMGKRMGKAAPIGRS